MRANEKQVNFGGEVRGTGARLLYSLCGLLVLPLAACDDDEGPVADVVEVCEGAVTTSHFGLGWDRLNHRVSHYSVYPGPALAVPAPTVGTSESAGVTMGMEPVVRACGSESVEAVFVGGDFTTGEVNSDAGILVWSGQTSGDANLRSVRLRIPMTVGPEGRAEGSLSVEDYANSLLGGGTAVALLEGVMLRTDLEQGAEYSDVYETRLGYTSRGFGAGVEVVDGQLNWWAEFRHGQGHDTVLRPDMNQAMTEADSGIELMVSLVQVVTGEVTSLSTSYTTGVEEAYRNTEDFEPWADEEDRMQGVVGSAGGGEGILGLTSFDLQLEPPTECLEDSDCDYGDSCGSDGHCEYAWSQPGYYVRDLQAGVRLDSYDDTTGAAEFEWLGYASAASELIAFRPMQYTFEGSALWIQGVQAESHSLQGEVPVGQSSTPMTGFTE